MVPIVTRQGDAQGNWTVGRGAAPEHAPKNVKLERLHVFEEPHYLSFQRENHS